MSKHNPFLDNSDMSQSDASGSRAALEDFIHHRLGDKVRAESLRRLMDNSDFKALILDGFMKADAIRNLELATVHEDAHEAKVARGAAEASVHLRGFFAHILQLGDRAETAIAGAQAEISRLDAEETDAE